MRWDVTTKELGLRKRGSSCGVNPSLGTLSSTGYRQDTDDAI